MNWVEFLTDAELNNATEYHQPPNGELLFQQIRYDVLTCLSKYRSCVELITWDRKDYPATTLHTLVQWDNTAEDWFTRTMALYKDSGIHESTSLEWTRYIAEIGEIIQGVPDFQTEVEAITPPEAEEAKQLLQIGKQSVATLKLLYQDIQTQNYKHLWATRMRRKKPNMD